MNKKNNLFLVFSFSLCILIIEGCQDTNPTSNTALSLSGPTGIVYIGATDFQTSIPIEVSGSGNQTATNIEVLNNSIPAGIAFRYQNPNGTHSANGCAAVASGQTCTVLLTCENTTIGNYILQITATNTSPINVNLNVQFPSLTLTTTALTDTAYTLQLTNAAQVPVNDLNFTLPSTPSGWSVDTSTQTCTTGQTLSANASCILANIIDTTSGDPADYQVIVNGSNLENSQVLNAFSPFCTNKLDNFNYQETQAPYFSDPNILNASDGVAWGPYVDFLNNGPQIQSCTDNPFWAAARLNTTAAYWISQKVNYCHHHAPTWIIPIWAPASEYQNGNNCSTSNNLMPGTVGYNTLIRWNYSGTGSETASNWQNTQMWQGLDCSDYTGLLYNFGLGTILNTDVAFQAGQYYYGGGNPNTWPSWVSTLTPNQQTSTEYLFSPDATGLANVGALVCADGTPDRTHHSDSPNLCAGHGGYISVANDQGVHTTVYTGAMLAPTLQPGDLLYFGIGPGDGWSPSVVHVMMWTGKQVGYGVNDIPPTLIAPEEHCPMSDWKPQIGDWVITDSHYQGPDYRIFTSCYYGTNLWGVRRILNINS